jgi:hypothetical protein
LGGKLAQLDLMRRQARMAQAWRALSAQA